MTNYCDVCGDPLNDDEPGTRCGICCEMVGFGDQEILKFVDDEGENFHHPEPPRVSGEGDEP